MRITNILLQVVPTIGRGNEQLKIEWIAQDECYSILGGTIGDTHCCGSCEIYGGKLTSKFLIEIIRATRASIILGHWNIVSWNSKVDVPQIEYDINEKYKDVFKINIHELNHSEVLIFVNVLDINEYYSFVSGDI